MSNDHFHRPLNPDELRWLLYLSDPSPQCLPPDGCLGSSQLNLILTVAALHSVLPATLRAAEKIGTQKVAPPGQDDWSKILEQARLQVAYLVGLELILGHHATRACAAFRAAHIEAAVVKGATFARCLYPDAALRSFTDVDILIRKEHRAKASAIMKDLGFELFQLEDRLGKEYFEDKWLLKTQPNVMIELHCDLVHSPKLRGTMSLTYDDLLEVGQGDPESPSALLLVAGAHAAIGHQFDRLQHLVDVTRAAEYSQGALDLDRLRRVARRGGLTVALRTALDLAGRTYRHPVCRDLAEQLDGSLWSRAVSRCVAPRVVANVQSTHRARGSWRRKLFRQLIRLA